MSGEILRNRTKAFALRIIRMCGALPERWDARALGHQVLRSGTSVGAHFREGHRARSDAEMISKFEVALQELDERSTGSNSWSTPASYPRAASCRS